MACPSHLRFLQYSVNARDACSCEDFCVRDHVLPLDAQNSPQTFCMEVVELSGVTAVHSS